MAASNEMSDLLKYMETEDNVKVLGENSLEKSIPFLSQILICLVIISLDKYLFDP